MSYKLKPMPFVLFIIFISLYFATAMNVAFFQAISVLLKPEEKGFGFLISLPFFLFSGFLIIFTALSWRFVFKPVAIILVVFSALFSYAGYHYNVIFDRAMYANIFQTDTHEAKGYFNLSLILWFLGFGIFPAVVVLAVKIKDYTWKEAMKWRAFLLLMALSIFGIVAFLYSQDYIATSRNYRILVKHINPISPIIQFEKYLRKDIFKQVIPYEKIAEDAKAPVRPSADKPRLVVVILGETQRAANYSLGGYERQTNPYTSQLPIYYFENIRSYGTATAISVPYIFAMQPDRYEAEKANYRDNVMDVLLRAGIKMRWVENDGGCKGVCKDIFNEDIREIFHDNEKFCQGEGCYDALFIDELKEEIPFVQGHDAVIVLHVQGSHGPTYYQRYPREFAKFLPDCQRSDIQNCDHQELINTYDNTILYFDYIMAELIKILQTQTDHFAPALIFFSDHGESLGEKGVYLHGMPRMIAPDEQVHIPFIAWFSEAFKKQSGLDAACLEAHQKRLEVEHLNISDTLLGLFKIETKAYTAERDLLHPCYSLERP